MRRLRPYLSALSLLICLANVVPAWAREDAARRRIAVFPMESAVREVSGEELEGAITDALVRASRYDVVSRTRIGEVLAEQRINNSDLVDPEQARSVGKLLGADYIVTGRLLSSAFEPGFFSKDEFISRAQLQVIEAETGRVLVSETLVGKRTTLVMRRGTSLSSLSKAERDKSVSESLGAVAEQFVARVDLLHPLTGYVVKVDGDRVAVNLGRASGVKPGHELLVVEEAEPIRDPVTNEVLSTERKPLARLVVTSVEEKLAWARVAATYSPAARVDVGGERVDLRPVRGLVEPQMTVMQTAPRAAAIEAELERARRRRGR